MAYRGKIIDSCLTATDMLGKMVHIFPITSTATALQVANLFHDGVFRLHGMPEAIISDQDRKFTGKFWDKLHHKVGVKRKMTTSAHPQGDRQLEVTNKTAGTIMQIFVEDNPSNWAVWTADVEFAINSTTSSTTSLSPFEDSYSFLPTVWPTSTWSQTGDVTAERFAERSHLNWLRATDALIASRVEIVTQANKSRHRDSPEFQVGSSVYVPTKYLVFPAALARKFVPKFIGPFPISASFPKSSNFEVDLPPHLCVH